MTTPPARSPARITMTVIGLVLLTALALVLLYATRHVVTWIVVAAFFAVALHPTVTWIERRVTWCRRWLSTLVVFLLVFVVIAGLVTLFVVPLVNEVGQLADQLPALVRDTRAGRGPLGGLINRFHLRQYAEQHSEQLRGYVSGLGGPTLAVVRGAATAVVGIVTVFVLSYLMVLQGPRLVDASLALFAPRRAERIRRVARECARTITGYISGNLLISVICGLLTYAVLAVLRVPFAGLISLFVAVADLIPMVGATLGAIVAVLAGFFESLTAGIVVLGFFIVYQQLENHLLQPVILSRTVQLDPLTVLVSILIATELAGILGALLAIPVAAMLRIVARELWKERRARWAEQTARSGRAEPLTDHEESPRDGHVEVADVEEPAAPLTDQAGAGRPSGQPGPA